MTCKKPFALFVACYLAILATGAASQEVGKVISVDPGASLIRLQQPARLAEGVGISTGDVITTDRRGRVQLLFTDETRVAVGPNSRFVVENVTLASGGTASTFAVSAVEGTFRFISGRSRKSAYAISTPTATMGIRGTAFDFAVRRRLGTDIVIFSGAIRMCGRAGNCVRVSGRCTAVQLDAGGNFSSVRTKRQKRALIAENFSFISDQDQLQPEFRTTVDSCGRDVIGAPPPVRDERAAPRRDPPAPEPPAPEPPAPEPPAPEPPTREPPEL